MIRCRLEWTPRRLLTQADGCVRPLAIVFSRTVRWCVPDMKPSRWERFNYSTLRRTVCGRLRSPVVSNDSLDSLSLGVGSPSAGGCVRPLAIVFSRTVRWCVPDMKPSRWERFNYSTLRRTVGLTILGCFWRFALGLRCVIVHQNESTLLSIFLASGPRSWEGLYGKPSFAALPAQAWRREVCTFWHCLARFRP